MSESLPLTRPSRLSMMWISLSLGVLLLTVLQTLKLNPAADLVWALNLQLSFPGKYLLSLGISLALATSLVYFVIRRAGLDKRMRIGGGIQITSAMTLVIPLTLSVFAYYFAAKRGEVVGAAEAVTWVFYERDLVGQILLWPAVFAVVLLGLNHWFELRITLGRRKSVV